MIARLYVLLPYPLTIPDSQEFPIYEYADEGYSVRILPPVRSDRPIPPHEEMDEILLDGAPAFQADVLQIDFYKESFRRERDRITSDPPHTLDPPHDVVRRAIDSFLLRLRHVTHAGHVRPLDFPACSWRIQYLNDDGTELERDDKLFRAVGTLQVSLRWTALNKPVWEDVMRLPIDFEPFPWEELLLDARNDLPRVGPSVVLAATALEVFIAHILDLLAAQSPVPAPLWGWLNDRDDNHLRQPSVEEQYDTLLQVFTGHSLKEATGLWEVFMNLKTPATSSSTKELRRSEEQRSLRRQRASSSAGHSRSLPRCGSGCLRNYSGRCSSMRSDSKLGSNWSEDQRPLEQQ